MKAFVLKEPGVVGWHDAPEPQLKQPYGAILRPVAVTPCSSDVHTVFGGGSPKAPNLILGHECVAQVLEVGEETLEDTPCRRLTLDTTDADGEKVVCTVWLAEEDPVYAELSREGKLLLSVRFTAFQQTESDGGE